MLQNILKETVAKKTLPHHKFLSSMSTSLLREKDLLLVWWGISQSERDVPGSELYWKGHILGQEWTAQVAKE